MSYNSVNMDEVRKRAKELGDKKKSKRKSEFFNFEKGKTVFRVLPPWSEKAASKGLVAKVIYKHFNLPPEKKFFNCGRETNPDKYESCALCDVLDKVDFMKSADQYHARGRTYLNAYVRYHERGDNKTKVNKVVVLQGPVSLNDWLVTQLADSEIGDFTDPKEGVDVSVTKTGEGLETRYEYTLIPKPKPLVEDKEELNKILSNLTDLDKLTKISDEELEKQSAYAKKMKSHFIKLKDRYSDEDESSSNDEAEESSESDDDGDDDPPKRGKKEAKESEESSESESEAESSESESSESDDAQDAKRSSLSSVKPPKIDSKTGKPICFKDWSKRNPSGETTDKQCQVCEFEPTCMFKSLKKAS